jgi:hypothetical protein
MLEDDGLFHVLEEDVVPLANAGFLRYFGPSPDGNQGVSN